MQKDLSKLTGYQLYQLVGTSEGQAAEAELDRRNAAAARKVARRSQSRKPTYRMVDYAYEHSFGRENW